MNDITTRLSWYNNRLRCMSMGEIVYRVNNKLQAEMEKKGFGLCKSGPMNAASSGRPWLENLPAVSAEVYQASADKVLAGIYDVFALKGVSLGFPPKWNKDVKTGVTAPMEFGKTLNYRNESKVGDIKYLWEPNRHLELVTLAQAFRLTGDQRYADGIRKLLTSWFQQCPYPLGVNWTSSLEHAVRLVNWTFAWQILGGEQSPLFVGQAGRDFRQEWLESIYQHLHFVSGHFSRYSSANNHLLGEYMGLFIGSVTWPYWDDCRKWRDIAFRGFEHEALKQNSVDGVNLEQSVWYHHEVVDMMLLCGLVGRANGIEFSQGYWNRLEAMLNFVAAIMDVNGHVPMIGDSDDAVMVRFFPGDLNVYRSLLATGAVLFNRHDFRRKAGKFDDKSRWLLGDEAQRSFDAMRVPTEPHIQPKAFPRGGYYVLGKDLDTAEETRIVVDSGPLGYLAIAAHGHADALAFTLSISGNEILIDTGTYAYHTEKKWRDYFRGTAAHNTVRIDRLDQSVAGGNFLWLKHARAECLTFESGHERDLWIGWHDGYRRLPDPVTHKRSIFYDKTANLIQVKDRIECKQEHQVEIFWHFSESCLVEVQDSRVSARNKCVVTTISMTGTEWRPELVRGRNEPPLGWVSRSFDEKVPTDSIVWTGRVVGTTELNTHIKISSV